jgi:hypothetical protein
MSNEHAFWDDLATRMNPGWTISVGKDFNPGDGALGAAYDTFVYMIDTSTLWISAGATKNSEVLRAKQQLAQSRLPPGAAADAAGLSILECGKQSTPADHADAARAITAAVCAVTETQTYQQALARTGSPAGHWIWLVYKLKNDGTPLGRPLYAKDDSRHGFMTMDQLKDVIAAALSNDIANPDSSVGAKVRAGGGVDLHPELSAMFAQVTRERQRP